MKVIKYFDKEEESFNNICRHGLNSNTNKESLLAVCLPNSMAKKLHFFSFPLIKEEKWIIGAKTKYDIPQYIEGIPDGFAIFCTTWEAGKVRKYKEQVERKNERNMEKREVEDMDVMNKRLAEKAMNKNSVEDKNSNEDSENEELEEPLPRGINKYCHICNNNYDNYLTHIKSLDHFENLKRYKNNINRFKNTFQNIINFWENKKGEKLAINNIKSIDNNALNNNKNIIDNAKNVLSKPDNNSKKEKIKKENDNSDIDMINNSIINNKENINNNNSNLIKKENIIGNSNNTNSNVNNIKINNNSNIINDIIKENINISNNIKLEENQENNISSIINLHSFNLTCSTDNKTNINSIFNINNILTMNSNNNHCLNTTNKNNININNINKNNSIINKIKENLNLKQDIKLGKDNIKPQKIFVTNSIPLFSNLSKCQLIGSQKRKRDEQPEKTMDIFVVSTPKKIKYDRFPLLSRDNPKKLINNSILFFK